jgi:peroxiredoxin
MFDRNRFGLFAGMAAAVTLTAAALITASRPASAEVQTGAPAPAFTLTDSNGKSVSLSDFAGKTVVLEWTNDGCPFVKKHYADPTRNMQTLQSDAAEDGVVWLSVISSAQGKQGHADGARANELTTTRGAAPAHVLLDPTGAVGRLYAAKTTPHMFVIDGTGTLAYDGAIDSNPSANPSDIAGATNYVTAALDAVAAGRTPDPATTKPYGCSVKY